MSEVAAGMAKQLAPQLYSDLKSFMVSLGGKARALLRRTTMREFGSPQELREAVISGAVRNGEWVKLRTKISPFGPFLRHHFLTPFIGFRTDMRLGPQLVSNHPFMGLIAQTMSHLSPVGLYPPVSSSIAQACLYGADANVLGFVGLVAAIDQNPAYLPALVASRHSQYYSAPVFLTGIIRYLEPDALAVAGFSPEQHEELRQAGDVWFFDATHDDSACTLIGDPAPTEMWGGLYAAGHLESSATSITVAPILNAMMTAMRASGFEPMINQNQAARREYAIHARGVRMTVDSRAPLFSLHMDADVGRDFAASRAKFDKLLVDILRGIEDACAAENAILTNARDLDFNYSNSSDAFSVLKSAAAEHIKDPVLIAIRDWHRSRGV